MPLLQSDFKNKIRAVKYWKRHAKWAQWKSLHKNNPKQYKIKIKTDDRYITAVLSEFGLHGYNGMHAKPFWAPIDSMVWSID